MNSSAPSTHLVARQTDADFPPESTRLDEIEAALEFLSGVVSKNSAIYVSAPITSGQRLYDWFSRLRSLGSTPSPERYSAELLEQVILPNRRAVKALVEGLRESATDLVIDPTAVGDLQGWTQSDYRIAWARVIQEYAHTVVFADGWQFSNGCAYEYLIAAQQGKPRMSSNGLALADEEALSMLSNAIAVLTDSNVPATFLRAVSEQLRFSATVALDESLSIELKGPTSHFKDAVLDDLAGYGNVAQFVSFSPSVEQRFSRILGHVPNTTFSTTEEAVTELLRVSPEQSLNIRTYEPHSPRSREFVYGVRNVAEIIARVRAFSDQGLYTIVNETIDVKDGGVSGVRMGTVMEFAPEDTPRCVEKEGTASLPAEIALSMLRRVYGFTPSLPGEAWRTEFSVHPLRRGYRNEHTVLWESEAASVAEIDPGISWPNRFSTFLGDKVYGLLVAEALGFLVPETTAFCRAVAPFSFGRSTGSGETWIRTCPAEAVPGKFTTHRGWLDPFALLNAEDPTGLVRSVLAQEGVEVLFSGAAIGREDDAIIEGVKGLGDTFMLGKSHPEPLPEPVTSAVRETLTKVVRALKQPTKVEWGFDGNDVWILQLQLVDTPEHWIVVPGPTTSYLRFKTSDGLDRLRELIEIGLESNQGIELIGAVGLTSHVGDLLRKARIPSRIVRSH